MKILLVDDDPAVLQALLGILKRNPSYQTTVGTNGPLAIENGESMGGVDLLITDVVMEPMDGFTLRQRLKELYPAMHTIFISGYDLSEYDAHTAGCDVLTKPIEAETLLQAVAKVEPLVPKPDNRPRPVAAVPVRASGGGPRVAVVSTPEAPVHAAPSAPKVVSASAASGAGASGAVLENEEVFPSDDLLNKKIGNYNIVWKIGEDEWGPVYVAVQTSMARPVAMKVLSDDIQRTMPGAKAQFIATARAKASVKHPAIFSVYEAGEASGHTYYTYEYVDGAHLAEMKEQGLHLDDQIALKTIKVVAEGMAYLAHQKIPHSPIAARRIYIGKDKTPHLSNPATLTQEGDRNVQHEIQEVSKVICDVLPGGVAKEPGLQSMLLKMQMEGSSGYLSWGALLQAVKALEPKVIPVDAMKLTAQEQAAIRAVDEAKRQQKRVLIMTSVGIFVLLWAAVMIVWWIYFRSNERDLSEQVHIPAGEFTYQNGKATTGEFWMDKYEVTIGQYAKFLSDLNAHPTTKFDHPDQPKGKSHVPCGADMEQWNTYYGRARAGLPARYVPIDLNCPIFNVDYWDAYAYAKWAGKRLPTEQEWEKAARGGNGNVYPWGNDLDAARVNSGADYIAKPGPDSKGTVDGYFWWNPVDAISGDKSPYGVIGMAGNVAEWTDSWDEKHQHPVIRGGSFHSKDVTTTHRVTDIDPEAFYEFVGFRCVSDTPSKK